MVSEKPGVATLTRVIQRRSITRCNVRVERSYFFIPDLYDSPLNFDSSMCEKVRFLLSFNCLIIS